MQVIPVDIDMTLPEDGVVDLFILQFHSPDPIENGFLGKLPSNVIARRQVFLKQFLSMDAGHLLPRKSFEALLCSLA